MTGPTPASISPTRCSGTDVLATREEILAGCETFYGVPLAEIGEDGAAVLAIGHYEPRRILAALLAFARSRGWQPYEVGLADTTLEKAEKARQWRLIYRHAGAATADIAGNDDWCVCQDCHWWAVDAGPATPGATAVMWWSTA